MLISFNFVLQDFKTKTSNFLSKLEYLLDLIQNKFKKFKWLDKLSSLTDVIVQDGLKIKKNLSVLTT